MLFFVNLEDFTYLEGQGCLESKRDLVVEEVKYYGIRSVLSDLQLRVSKLNYN